MANTPQRDTRGNSSAKPISDMDPEGMDPEFDGEGDLDSPENLADPALRGQQADQSSPTGSQDDANKRRTHFSDDPVEGENESDEDEEDVEPRSPQPPHNRRESDRNRPTEPGDRRR